MISKKITTKSFLSGSTGSKSFRSSWPPDPNPDLQDPHPDLPDPNPDLTNQIVFIFPNPQNSVTDADPNLLDTIPDLPRSTKFWDSPISGYVSII